MLSTRRLGEHGPNVPGKRDRGGLAGGLVAGQHDTYLNVVVAAVLDHISRRWASVRPSGRDLRLRTVSTTRHW